MLDLVSRQLLSDGLKVSLFPYEFATFLYESREPGGCLKSCQSTFVYLTALETPPRLPAPMEISTHYSANLVITPAGKHCLSFLGNMEDLRRPCWG